MNLATPMKAFIQGHVGVSSAAQISPKCRRLLQEIALCTEDHLSKRVSSDRYRAIAKYIIIVVLDGSSLAVTSRRNVFSTWMKVSLTNSVDWTEMLMSPELLLTITCIPVVATTPISD